MSFPPALVQQLDAEPPLLEDMEEGFEDVDFVVEAAGDFPFPGAYEVQAMALLQILSTVNTLIDAMRTSVCLTAPDSHQSKQTPCGYQKNG